MQQLDINKFLTNCTDGQQIRVILASGRVFDGVYDATQTDETDALYFETLEGQELRAEWDKITDIDYRPPRAAAGKMFAPPEHPLSGAGPTRYNDRGVPLRPHTKRNR